MSVDRLTPAFTTKTPEPSKNAEEKQSSGISGDLQKLIKDIMQQICKMGLMSALKRPQEQEGAPPGGGCGKGCGGSGSALERAQRSLAEGGGRGLSPETLQAQADMTRSRETLRASLAKQEGSSPA